MSDRGASPLFVRRSPADPADEHEERIDDRPGSGALSRTDHRRDSTVRRWGVVTPSATVIGRASDPDADVPERLRRLHDEHHPATGGHAARAHRLERLRVTQALCNSVGVTPWQRDRALGLMDRIDLTAFGSQRAISKVALVVIRHVVDLDRRRQLGLEDDEYLAGLDEQRLTALYERYREHDITREEAFEQLAERHGLDRTSLDRLRRVLTDQLDEETAGAAYGRSPARDPNLPGTGREHERSSGTASRDRENE
jgi:hypothetical protein